jgi:hypothetical protein
MPNISSYLDSLFEAGLSPASIREVIQSSLTNKISRTFLTDRQLYKCAPIFECLNLKYYLSDSKYLFNEDTGKGGFSNAIAEMLPNTSPYGAFMVHLGQDSENVFITREADLKGDHRNVGLLLGIPSCCIDAFIQNSCTAESLQNDHTLNSCNPNLISINPWSVHCAQYFGYGLVSYFPCSPNCDKTAEIALNNALLLKEYTPDLYTSFTNYQMYTYLYTEYDGIYAFKSPLKCRDGIIYYDNMNIESSSRGLLSELLVKGNQLKILTSNNFTIASDDEVLITINSKNVRLYYSQST